MEDGRECAKDGGKDHDTAIPALARSVNQRRCAARPGSVETAGFFPLFTKDFA
ncbi:hypothetical protein SFOMI_4058 [Sphingobium fuliginis]|uniref:Uncharacterized protein n=1 Tax=Sphingobium fuliginis (strain ATCC 27551) TaxID=336203 RepID=A0A292ZKQ4_SPHSA|nr:hypothetical protein SFOMI_4058 [Sphingobium fuliginis]